MERRRREERRGKRRVQERGGRRGRRAFAAAFAAVRREGSIGGERAGGAGADVDAFAAAVRREGSVGGERAGGAGADETGPRETKPDAGDGAAGPIAGVAERQGGAIAALAVAEVGVARARRRQVGARGGSGHRERLGADAGRHGGAQPKRRGAVRKRDVVGEIGRRGRGVVAGGLAASEGAHAEVQAGKSQRGFHRVTPSFINTNERQADDDGRRGDSRRCKHPSKSRLNAVDSNTRQSRG